MTDPVEDLLIRTLRDPVRTLPAPADPLPAIRHRARVQRRNAVLGLAAVVLIAAAAVLAPAVAGRFTRPAPVATDPAPRGSGLLEWPASGPLAGDAQLVRDAIGRWQQSPEGRPTGKLRLLWAGRVGGDRVVLLQALGANGTPALAEVGDRAGEFTVLRIEPLGNPDVAALRLADPVAGRSGRTLLLPRPGAASVTVMTDPPRSEPVPAGDVVVLDGDLAGRPMAVLDRDDRIVGDGLVPETARIPVLPGRIRLISPVWDGSAGRLPQSGDYAEAAMLTERLDPGAGGPVEVGVVQDGSTLQLRSGRKAEPRLYEVHRGGRTYLGWIVWIGGTPHCAHLDDVTGSGGQPDAIVLRCDLPQDDSSGIVWVHLHTGIRLAGVRIEAARPGERTLAPAIPLPLDGGYVAELPGFPTGPGLVRLEDVAGLPRPPITLPRYKP